MTGEFRISMAAARVNARKTQEEVAKQLKVAKNTVVSWEKGKTAPTVQKAREFCDFCQIPYDRVSFCIEDAI